MTEKLTIRIGGWAALALAGLAFALAAPSGCSSKAGDSCDSSQCLPHNTCIATASQPAQCRFPCATHPDCPFNYHCDANAGGSRPYCVVNTKQFPPDKAGSAFGVACSPTAGFQTNPACDSADGFWCNATSPLDANAYCTYFGCAADTDCGDGFYCGKVNKYPNAASAQVPDGETLAACLKREYCAPCASDIDCAPSHGAPQHCIAGSDGATFCAHECHTNSECPLDATCASHQNYSACTPRAGVCKGDGKLCSPCRSDADCAAGGFCVDAYNSPERFCSTKSGTTCSYSSAGTIVDQCPTTTTATSNIGCAVPSVDPNIPADQCLGEVLLGTQYVPGCWSKH